MDSYLHAEIDDGDRGGPAYHPEQNKSVFKAGSTVPVKFQLKNQANVIVQAPSLPIWLVPEKGSLMSASVDESVYTASATYGGDFLSVNATALFGFSVAGLPKLTGPNAKPRILVGSPSGALDFGNSMLNLGATLNVLFSFAAGDNGLGKAYTFDPGLCGSIHTLPEKLIDFNGQKIEKNVQLNWITVAEENVNQYILEKSTDGADFGTMAYVFAKNNSSRNTYSMIDHHPIQGVNYYRLRIIEKDNSYSYSPIIRIKFDGQLNGNVVVAPNPVENQFKILLTGLEKGVYTLDIKNLSGQTVQRKIINVGQYEHIENMSKSNSMATGIYYLNVYNQNAKQVKVINFMVR